MNTGTVASALGTLFAELVNGSSKSGGYALNPGDEGLLRSLDKVSAADASVLTPAGSSIAAHVDHLRYGLSLLNRWSRGEKPFEDADWTASWRKTTVSETEWRRLKNDLLTECSFWLDVLRAPREVAETELNDMLGSIAHLAYHMGAIRQINRAARGPGATEQPS
jgi:hypothetical protein